MHPVSLITFWSPEPLSPNSFCPDYFATFFRRFGNIQCLHCENSRDRRTMQLLKQSDLVVVLLHQSHRELCRLLCTDSIRLSNCMYLIIDYVPDPELNLAQISREFRISPKRLGCIPYNPSYQAALQRGQIRSHPALSDRTAVCQGGLNFSGELRRSAHCMLQALGM